MSLLDRLFPWRHAPDTTEDAERQLRRLHERDPRVDELHRELLEAQRQNHFSHMVDAAIRRRNEEDR